MTVVARAGEVPTVADAAVAAEPLLAAGAEEVLLFGSVARGSGQAASDIDLVALFADINYAGRADLQRRLEEEASVVGGWPVQVVVTDRPEWRARTEKVPVSFERRISAEAVIVADSGVRGEVRWGKEMVRPMNNPEEALEYFTNRVLRRLSELDDATTPRRREAQVSLSSEDRETARLDRMIVVCEHAAMTVELALKSLAVLYGASIPSEKELRGAGHDIERCIRLVPEPPRIEMAAVVGRLGLNLQSMSQWRFRGTYADDIGTERGAADDWAKNYTRTALAVAEFVIAHLRSAVGDTPDMRKATDVWRDHAAFIASQDVRTGQPRNTGAGPTSGYDL